MILKHLEVCIFFIYEKPKWTTTENVIYSLKSYENLFQLLLAYKNLFLVEEKKCNFDK